MRGLAGVLLVVGVCCANAASAEVNYAIFPRPIEGAGTVQLRGERPEVPGWQRLQLCCWHYKRCLRADLQQTAIWRLDDARRRCNDDL
jgi:hypothetical protein